MAARERRNAMRSRLKEMMKAQAAAKRTGETESGVETGESGSIEVSVHQICVCVCVCTFDARVHITMCVTSLRL